MNQDPNAALALVSARPSTSKDQATPFYNNLQTLRSNTENGPDEDLKRAKDLINLHSSVKLAHRDGVDYELLEARKQVQKILNGL